MSTTFFDTRRNMKVTETVLFDHMGYPRDFSKLHELGVYPITYEHVEYDPVTQKEVPANELVFDESTQSYIQRFTAEDLPQEVVEQNQKQIQMNKDTERKEEIYKELDALDLKAARASRAVALALATGATPDEMDVSKLEEYETTAAALRSELSDINARLEQ